MSMVLEEGMRGPEARITGGESTKPYFFVHTRERL
jgi:hypothetical protein